MTILDDPRKSADASAPQALHPVPAVGHDFRPVQIVTVDIVDPVPAVPPRISRDGTPYTRARILVLLHDIPLGIVWADLSAGGIAAADLAGVIAGTLGSRIIT